MTFNFDFMMWAVKQCIGGVAEALAAVLRVLGSIPKRNNFVYVLQVKLLRIWLIVNFYFCKRIYDKGEIPSIGQRL